MKYTVNVARMISVEVEVEADTAEQAYQQVNNVDFELPPRNEWEGSKTWMFDVYDERGILRGADDGSGWVEE